MRKLFFLLTAAFMVCSLTVNAENALTKKLLATKANPISHFQKADSRNLFRFDNAKQTGPRRIADYDKKGEIKGAESFGTINGDDGSVWFYTISATESEAHPYSYGSATINLYDNTNALVTTVTYNVPDSMNINAIEPFGTVSTKFYDTDSKTKEFTVYLHEVGPNYSSIGHFLVYNTNGELVRQYDNMGNIIWFDATVKYDSYQRAIFVTEGVDSLGNSTTRMSIMKPASWSNKEPQEEHVFEVRDDLIEYSNGPCLNTYNIDGKPYYMLSYYEKPFTQGYDENYDIILTEDNNYIVEIYDKDYNQVTTFKVPVTHADDVYCSEYSCGLYSYNDLCKAYYSSGDSEMLNIVITRMDVRLDTDDDTYPYAFLVYNAYGSHIKTIAENVISWKQMNTLRSGHDQVGCICLNDGVETLEMIDLPSCEKAVTFEAETAGRKISSNYDRYPVGSYGYEYVIGMGDAESDAQGNVISSIGWFKEDGSLDHYVKFNLGQEGEYFTPLIEGYSLDPSLVNTDSAHEYIYIAKLRNANTGTIENVLILADENGNEIKRFAGGDEKTLRIASVVDNELGNPRLVVGYADNTLGSYDIDFYNLPFEKFAAGGDGSVENPYVITSPGDLKMMAKEPAAHYVLGKSIDMREIADPWTPVSQFSGTLNGQGNCIKNLYINGDDSYDGLFGYLVNDGCSVKDIFFTDPYIQINSGNRYVGLIAGMTMKAAIDSVFVSDLTIGGDGSAEVGGLVGQATYYTTIRSSYVNGYNSNYFVEECSNVGGIVGDTRTGTAVDACCFSGYISAKSAIGGIVGTTGRDCTVKNCHASVSLEGDNTIGGIVGAASRNEVSNNYVEGSVGVHYAETYDKPCVGGIIGSLESLWSGTPTVIVSGNVAALSYIGPQDDVPTVHRIVGFTIADEDYEEGETPRTEEGLANNYSTYSMAFGDRGANLVDGADVINANQEFLESIGYQFGMDYTAPWMYAYPIHLYIEDITVDGIEKNIVNDGSSLNTHNSELYNVAGQKVGENYKGIVIKNGKKYLNK